MPKNLRRFLGIEDIILVVLLGISYALCVVYEGGFQWGVIHGYLGFFLSYFPPIFVATRVLMYWRTCSPPRNGALRKVWEFFGGGLPDRKSTVLNDLTAACGTALLAFVLTFYSNVKVRIPFINQTVGDDTFKFLDTLLLGERFVPWLESYVSQRQWLIDFLDDVYFHDYKWMILLIFLFWVRGQRLEQIWLFKSVCIIYITGILWTVLYPSYGPFFFDLGTMGDRFAWLEGTKAYRSQGSLMAMWYASQETMTVGKPFSARPFLGIAAFPSLHIAHMTIIVVVARRDFPWLSIIVAFLTVVTFIATVAFGWHYAIDAAGGLLLGIAIPELLRKWMWARGESGPEHGIPQHEQDASEEE